MLKGVYQARNRGLNLDSAKCLRHEYTTGNLALLGGGRTHGWEVQASSVEASHVLSVAYVRALETRWGRLANSVTNARTSRASTPGDRARLIGAVVETL